jgi:hypothetical protein
MSFVCQCQMHSYLLNIRESRNKRIVVVAVSFFSLSSFMVVIFVAIRHVANNKEKQKWSVFVLFSPRNDINKSWLNTSTDNNEKITIDIFFIIGIKQVHSESVKIRTPTHDRHLLLLLQGGQTIRSNANRKEGMHWSRNLETQDFVCLVAYQKDIRRINDHGFYNICI